MVADGPYTYESLTRHLHFCQAFISLHPRQQVHDKGQTLLRLLVGKGRGIQEVRASSARWPRPTPTY